MGFGTAYHKQSVRLRVLDDTKDPIRYIGLGVRVTGDDLRCAVMVPIQRVPVHDGPEFCASFASDPIHRTPEGLPLVPEPELGFGWGIGAAIV